MTCEQKFRETYRREPEGLSSCLCIRVCPLGAHSDHQLGKVTGLAIDKGIRIAFAPKQNGVIEFSSLQFAKRAQWHVSSVPEQNRATGPTICGEPHSNWGSIPAPYRTQRSDRRISSDRRTIVIRSRHDSFPEGSVHGQWGPPLGC